MKVNMKNKVIGLMKLNTSLFLHIYDKDTEINKSWVVQLTKHRSGDLLTYEYGYKLYNFGFIRFGFNMSEM